MNPSMVESHIKALNSGNLYYLYRRDRSFRPIFIIPVKKLSKAGIKQDELIHITCFFLQFVISRAMVPGQIENWVVIFDVKGIGMLNVPKKLIKAVVKPLQQYFKGRLYRLHAINCSGVLKVLWKIAKKVVDPLTLQKFIVDGDKFQKTLCDSIGAENLEKKFGGTLEDKTSNFFPPDLK